MTAAPIRSIRTLNATYLKAHRDTHAREPTFGTHRHPYLHDTIRTLAREFAASHQRPPALLDYGCGKGAFLQEMRALDQLAAGFEEAVIEDVAQFAASTALFSVITKQTAKLAHVKPRSAMHWHQLIQRHLRVINTTIRTATAQEYAQGSAQERAIIIAAVRV